METRKVPTRRRKRVTRRKRQVILFSKMLLSFCVLCVALYGISKLVTGGINTKTVQTKEVATKEVTTEKITTTPKESTTVTEAKKTEVTKAEEKKTEETTKSSEEPKKVIQAWDQPSEPSYPTIKDPSQLAVKVSIADQRVYIQENGETIYTMVCSTGDSKVGNDTPKGNFNIQAERAPSVYFPADNDYVFNWVSFHNHGEYLFHSVIMLDEKTPNLEAAAKLGQEASHGCIRLPLPDSKWFYDNIPTGTPVEIY